MKFILKKMKNKKDRSAFLYVVYLLNFQRKKIITVQGKIRGSISKKIVGKKGFGYDPIFIPKKEKNFW